MASGVVPVTSDLPQVREVVEGYGETVSVGDVARFSEALVDILDGYSSLDGGHRRGRKTIVERHSWRGTAQETAARLLAL
jgi:glycosyltransferase involved in cell wall biosynthesis